MDKLTILGGCVDWLERMTPWDYHSWLWEREFDLALY